jgi:trigger factor
MKVTQEKLPASQIGLEIEISPETTKNTYEKVVQELGRTTNIPGFRKGKVPRQILVQRIGSQRIKAAALEEIIQNSLEQAIKQESIESLGNYTLRSSFDELIQQYKPGEALTFLAAVDVPPTVEIEDYQNLQVKAEEIVYDPKQVDDRLEQLRTEQATLVPVENRPAQMGDVAEIDYQGRFLPAEGEEEGIEISGTQAKDFPVELAQGKFIEGMVEGIVGMHPQETKKIEVKFPEDYPRQDLAGKPAVFTITLKELKEKDLPELDDELAEEISEFETMAELRASLEEEFQKKAEKETKKQIHQAIIQELLQKATIDLPETMIQKEVERLLTQTAIQMQQMGLDIKQVFNPQSLPQIREEIRPEAMGNLKQEFILQEISKWESIQVEPEAIEAKIKEVMEQLSDQQIDHDRLREAIASDLLKEKTLNWLQEKASVELVPKETKTEEQPLSSESSDTV